MADAEEIKRRLVGTYRLLAMEHFTEDGEVGHPFGENPDGMIIYTAGGHISTILMQSHRPKFKAGDILGGDPAELVAAFSTVSAFAGRYSIIDNQIIHHLEVTTYPNWTGTDQPRRFDLTDTHLTLYPPEMLMEGRIRRGRVHWERIE